MFYRTVNREEFVRAVQYFDPEFNVVKFKSLQKLFNYSHLDDLVQSVPLGVAFVEGDEKTPSETGVESTFQGSICALVTPVNGKLIGVILGYKDADASLADDSQVMYASIDNKSF